MRQIRIPRRAALPAAVLAAGMLLPAAPAAAAPAAGGGCSGYSASGGWWVQCQATGHGQGSAAGGGGHQACTWSPAVNTFFPGFGRNAPPAGKGFVYLVEVCGKTFGFPQLVANAGALTPAALAQRAYQELQPPLPDPQTAPPRGHDGLVGLPEWFWVPPRQWAAVTREVTAGAIWAQVTAIPARLVFSPGRGLPAMDCPGPGTPYDKSRPAAAQQSNCTFTYTASSDSQPGNAYAASLSITWNAAWRGSGGTGGALPALTRTTTFPLPIGEGQTLYGNGG